MTTRETINLAQVVSITLYEFYSFPKGLFRNRLAPAIVLRFSNRDEKVIEFPNLEKAWKKYRQYADGIENNVQF